MTRFARARGSKASNERLPHPPTNWNEMKQQLLEANDNKRQNDNDDQNEENFKKMRTQNYEKFLNEEAVNKTNTEWAEFEIKIEKNQIKNEEDDDDEAPVEVSAKQKPIKNVVKSIKTKAKPNKILLDVKPKEKNKVLKAVKTETRLIEMKKKRQMKQLMKRKGQIEVNSEQQPTANVADSNKTLEKKKNILKVVKIKTPQKQLLKKESEDGEKVEVKLEPSENEEKPMNTIDNKAQEKNKKVLMVVKNGAKSTELRQKRLPKQLLNDEAKNGEKVEENGQESVEETKQPKKDPSELTEKELKLIERNQKRRLKRLANKKLKKQQNHDSTSNIVNNNGRTDKKKQKQKHHKPMEEIQIINGSKVAVAYMDGFPIKKDDYERLIKLRNDLISKNIAQNEIDKTMKLERRKAEKSLTRERKNVCYKCRKSGHNLSECPEINNEHSGSGICFKCGSTEHTHFQCKVIKNDDYRYASCFICGEAGHIARQCKNNEKGVYPKGGNCNVCGSNEHLMKDCPQFKQEQQSTDDVVSVVGTLNHNENPEIDNVDDKKKTIRMKKIKKVKF